MGGVKTWIMLAEHLVAIALATGRAKDHIRILQFIHEKAVDIEWLLSILRNHRLLSRWEQFENRFLKENL